MEIDGAEKTLGQSNAVEIVEELLPAKNKCVFLAGKLKLPDHTVEGLEKQYTNPQERLYHVIVEFLKGVEPRPTWRVILDALRSPVVNLPRLAEDIERRHGFHPPPREPTSHVVEEKVLGRSDVVKVVSRIVDAKVKSEQLGRVLEIPPNVVDGIVKKYSNPDDQLFHIIDEFVKHHKKPTWRVIVDALKNPLIGLPGLARDIEKEF